MTIDEVIKQEMQVFLVEHGYCTREDAQNIAENVAQAVQQKFEQECADLGAEVHKLRETNNRLWDAIDRLREPKIPKVSRFFRRLGRRLKFWRN